MAIDFELEEAIGFNVNRAAFLMSEEIGRRFRAAGHPLGAQDFGLLHLLHREGTLEQSVVVARMLRDKTTITRRLDGLARKGLIERHPSPRDRRAVCVALTPAGRGAIEALIPIVATFQQEVLEGIPEADRKATLATLKQIITRLRNRP